MNINIINKILLLRKIKFRFDLPKRNEILQLDEHNSESLKKAIKRNFNIVPQRKREIYFWILAKQIIFFDFRFSTYLKNFIKYTSTKIVITLIDNNINFYKLKNLINNVCFISIQNGLRIPSTIWKSEFIAANLENSKNLKCDYFFVHNKYLIKKYKNIINCKYYILGNYKNNCFKIKKTKFKNSYLFLGMGVQNWNRKRIGISHKLLSLLASYFEDSNIKLNILLKNYNSEGQKKEIEFYRKFFKFNCIFHKSSTPKKSYKILDEFENIIFTNSTLGFEAISRKKKVAVFSVNKDKIEKKLFGWPKKLQKNYNFFLANKLTYSEIKRVLENVNNCKQAKWEKKYYRKMDDLMYFDQDNFLLRKVIKDTLKNFEEI